jgi:ectoine hydroxylase-related dioxygenase (phytanoyl-CoA dioxygenase family)
MPSHRNDILPLEVGVADPADLRHLLKGNDMAANQITSQQWKFYEDNGYLKLGKLLSDSDLTALQKRIDEIMLGKAKLDYSRIFMQLDSDTGKYEDIGVASRGHKGATLNYRKIQDLEFDDLFLAYMERPIFREICAKTYGPQTPIAALRAMFMNKPAHKGTFLPWHQDRWSFLDRDPKITLWTALDPATVANGCVQIVPGSHKAGLINPSHPSGFLTPEQAAKYCPPEKIEFLELEPGEAALLHNWLLHASDVNKTEVSRRAFSVCYMDASTMASDDSQFTRIFT